MHLRCIAAAATASLLLIGCGGNRATPKGPPETPQVDTLEITRSDPFHQTVPEPIPGSISDLDIVRQLYGLLVSMPPFPKNVATTCPQDAGVRYHLVFLSHGQTVLSADADPEGCELVQVADGRTLWAEPSSGSGPAFWALFAQAVDLPLSEVIGIPVKT